MISLSLSLEVEAALGEKTKADIHNLWIGEGPAAFGDLVQRANGQCRTAPLAQASPCMKGR